MFVDFSSSIQYVRPLAPSLQDNKIKNIVTYCALVILLGCTAYWIYSHFWKVRQVNQQAPQVHKKNISTHFKDIHPQVAKESLKNFPDNQQGDHLSVPHIDQKSQVKAVPSQYQPKDAPPLDPLAVPGQKVVQHEASKSEVKAEDEKIENQKSDEILIENDFDDVTEDLPLDDSLTMEENIEKRLDAYLRQERSKYAYGGVFYRYEGVYAGLKDLQRKNKADYVNFCNTALMNHFEENKNCDHLWELNISIDPDQRFVAWKILSDELENTSLCIQGAIHSSEKCEPGKGIILQFLIADHSKQKELRQFLTLLAHHLSKDSILVDSRPLNPEPLLGIIPCEGVPDYFSYGTDTFVVVDDQVWDALLLGRNVDKIIDGKVVKIEDDPKIMIKASHYRTMGDTRVNPFSIQNPFENLAIGSLNLS